MIEFLSLPLVGSITGLLGIILAVIFYVKSKAVSKPFYSIHHEEIININNIKDGNKLKLFYEDSQVTQLHKTTILFGNNGSKTINQEDLVPQFLALDFSLNNSSAFQIFQIEKHTSKESMKVDTKYLDGHFLFSFNYLDKQETLYISITHNA